MSANTNEDINVIKSEANDGKDGILDTTQTNEPLVTFTLDEYKDIQDRYAEVIVNLEEQVSVLQEELRKKDKN